MSWKKTSFKVFFALLGLTIIVIIIVNTRNAKNQYKTECKNDSDCKNSRFPYSKCLYDPDYNQNVCVSKDSKVCSLISPQLCKCTSSVGNGQVCGGSDCKSCVNEPQFECVHLDKQYVWRQGDQKITIPKNEHKDEGWCMPPIPQGDTTCNPFTSDTILIQKSDTEYEWGCECKYPSQITQNHPTSDCNIDKTCGNDKGDPKLSKLYVPNIKKANVECKSASDCDTGDICYSSLTNPSIQNKCYSKWVNNPTNIDPIKYGICVCPNMYEYIGEECQYPDNKDQCDVSGSVKECIPNSCGGPDGERGKMVINNNGKKYCKCNENYINCSATNESEVDAQFSTSCRSPVCLDDPCAPGGKSVPVRGGNGSYCECDNSNHYYKVDDQSSVNGQACVQLCKNNGPCGQGDTQRGTCAVLPGDDKTDPKAVCIKCKCGYADYDKDKNPFCYLPAPSGKPQASGASCNINDDCCSKLCLMDCTGNPEGMPYCWGTVCD